MYLCINFFSMCPIGGMFLYVLSQDTTEVWGDLPKVKKKSSFRDLSPEECVLLEDLSSISDKLHFRFSFTWQRSSEQTGKVNLLSGETVRNKNLTDILTLLYSIQNSKKKKKDFHILYLQNDSSCLYPVCDHRMYQPKDFAPGFLDISIQTVVSYKQCVICHLLTFWIEVFQIIHVYKTHLFNAITHYCNSKCNFSIILNVWLLFELFLMVLLWRLLFWQASL